MSQRIGYRQELANRYLEYMRQAETLDKPAQETAANPTQEHVQEASRDGVAYRSASDALKPSLKNQLDAAFMQGRAQRENDLGAAELERREKSGQRHSADGGGVGLRRPLRLTDPTKARGQESAAERIAQREEHFEKAVDKNEEMVARVQAGEAPEGSELDALAEQRPTTSETNDTIQAETKAPTTDPDDRVELSSAAAQTEAEVTRTDVVFDPADSAYRAAYLKGAETASGEGKSIVDRDRTETMVGESHRAAPDEKTRVTRSDDV